MQIYGMDNYFKLLYNDLKEPIGFKRNGVKKMDNVLSIIKDSTLTYEQRVIALAKAAENSLQVFQLDDTIEADRKAGIICDLFEGNAPYRPRYIVPDYDKLMKEGCEFLRLTPPTNIWEAVNTLLIFYKHVPSITSFPVYVGNIDTLLEPFIENEEEAYQAIKLFLTHIDRTLTDSFCHANIGPSDTRAGRLILRAEKELGNAVPNITLKYSHQTPDELARLAVETALKVAKPSFANHEMFVSDLGEAYGIASCYNGLPIAGGSYTLVRLNLAALAKKARGPEDFIKEVLPQGMKHMAAYMDARVKFLVEDSGFFEHHFLVKEGFIKKERFTAMFGMFGLAEAVNYLLKADEPEKRFGHGKEANDLGVEIIEKMQEVVKQHHNPHCQVSGGHYLLHAQVGIDTDQNTSPGCRIPIGEEPEILEHLMHSSLFHPYFPSGIGDIFTFDSTTERNPQYILDIIKGAFKQGVRYFSLYSSDCDVIRITGYLVKRSDMEKLDLGEQVLHDSVVLGLGAVKNQRVLERRVREND